jgi:t-SNARE complex subunit (syntaxin)
MPKVTMSINDFYKIIGNVKLKYPVGAKKGQDFYPFQYDGSNMPVPNYNDFKNMFDGLAYRIVENAAYSTKLLAAISTQFTNGQFVIADLKSADSQTPKQLYTGGGWANFAWDFTWDEIAHSGKGYGGPSSKNAIDSVLNATKSIKSTYIDKMAEGWSLGKYWEDIKRIKEISNAISVISSKTVSQFGNSLRDSMVGLKVIGNGATDVLTQTTTDIGELIKFVAELSTTVVTQVSAEISKKIKEILDNLTKFLTDLMTALNQDTADLRDAIVGMVSEMWTAMSQDIMNIYKSLSETMGTASLNLAKSLESNASKIGPAMETMMADYSDWAKTSLTTVNDCMKHNMNVLTNQFASSIENAEALLNENINKVKAEITKTFDTFKADMTKLTDSLKADVETAKKNVESLKASVDASIQQLDTKTATLKADLDSKYNELSKTFESRQKEVLGQLTTIQDEVKKNADSVKKIYADITSIQSRLSDLEGKAKSAKPSWAFW